MSQYVTKPILDESIVGEAHFADRLPKDDYITPLYVRNYLEGYLYKSFKYYEPFYQDRYSSECVKLECHL